jgi:hypothetical protein
MASLVPVIEAPESPEQPVPFSQYFVAPDEIDEDSSKTSRTDHLHSLITVCRTARLSFADVKPLELLSMEVKRLNGQ